MMLGMPLPASERQRSRVCNTARACLHVPAGGMAPPPHSHLLYAPADPAALCCACCRAMLHILGEDKAMVERLRPEALSQEYSVRADLPQIAFRWVRGGWQAGSWVCLCKGGCVRTTAGVSVAGALTCPAIVQLLNSSLDLRLPPCRLWTPPLTQTCRLPRTPT